MWRDEEIKGKILHKLTRMGKFEHSHTSIDNLPKGFPTDLRGRVKDMVKELKKEERKARSDQSRLLWDSVLMF